MPAQAFLFIIFIIVQIWSLLVYWENVSIAEWSFLSDQEAFELLIAEHHLRRDAEQEFLESTDAVPASSPDGTLE